MEPTDSEFMRELMTVFCAEAEERLATIDHRLLAIERPGDGHDHDELIADLMRELHTLKGSAGAVNLPDVSRLAHGLESHFSALTSSDAARDDIFERGYRGLDAMREIIAAGAQGMSVDIDVEGVLDQLASEPADQVAPHDPIAQTAAIAHETAIVQGGNSSAAAVASGGDDWSAAQPVATAVHAASGLVAEAGTEVVEPDAEAEPVATERVTAAPRAPEASPEGGAQRSARGEGVDEIVRLSTSKLDSLMARVGELVVTRIGTERRTAEVRGLTETMSSWEDGWRRARPDLARLAAAVRGNGSVAEAMPELERLLPLLEAGDASAQEMGRQLAELRSGLEADERRLAQVTGDIESEVRRTRMLPVSTVFDPMHRLVRDLARDLGKEVHLEIEGGNTEVDRSVLEQVRGPLTHLIRNALDHGIEPPDERELSGKPRRATLRLAATQHGGSLMLAIGDDGCGIDAGRIRDRSLELGLVSNDQLRVMTERDILRLVFRPSFSTAGTVTDLSGRGVGLDVVRETVERLNGMVDVASDRGVGTTFTLSLPLSVATTQALLIEIAGMVHALPIGAVSRIVSVDAAQIGRAQGREMVVLDDGPVVLVRLEDVLQLTSTEDATESRRPVIVVGSDERRLGVAVDRLLGTQDIVVKPLPKPFERVRHVAGATVLATGEVVVVLNTSDLVRSAVRTAARVDRSGERQRVGRPSTGDTVPVGQVDESGSSVVMVVDDSIVTRMLEKSILEAAGYTVQVAADGAEAFHALLAQPADLVVSDVNMPNMDGLALTQQIRAHSSLRDIPIVLVTSLDAPDDQVRGMEAGADAYIVKSSFSQEGLLETVSRLITTNRRRHAQRSGR